MKTLSRQLGMWKWNFRGAQVWFFCYRMKSSYTEHIKVWNQEDVSAKCLMRNLDIRSFTNGCFWQILSPQSDGSFYHNLISRTEVIVFLDFNKRMFFSVIC